MSEGGNSCTDLSQTEALQDPTKPTNNSEAMEVHQSGSVLTAEQDQEREESNTAEKPPRPPNTSGKRKRVTSPSDQVPVHAHILKKIITTNKNKQTNKKKKNEHFPCGVNR